MDERKKMKRWGPFTVSLPPSEQALLSAWLKYAAAQMGSQIPTLTGYVRLQVRVGLVNDDDGRTLGQVVPAIMALLAGENIVDPGRVADVEARWDRVVPQERMSLTISETTPPAWRIGAETRQRLRESQHRRWAASRASEGAAA